MLVKLLKVGMIATTLQRVRYYRNNVRIQGKSWQQTKGPPPDLFGLQGKQTRVATRHPAAITMPMTKRKSAKLRFNATPETRLAT